MLFGESAFGEAPFSASRSVEVGGIPTAARTAAAAYGGSRSASASSTGPRTAAAGRDGSRTAGARRKD